LSKWWLAAGGEWVCGWAVVTGEAVEEEEVCSVVGGGEEAVER
jgi:hypothetical protein